RIVLQLIFSNKDKLLAALISDTEQISHPSVMIWDLSSFELLWQVEVSTKDAQVTNIRMDSEGRLLFIGSSDGNLWIWDWKQEKYTQRRNYGRISSLDL